MHEAMRDQDANRSHYLADHGFRVLRFRNDEVQNQMDIVCKSILNELSRSLSRQGEGGPASSMAGG